MTLFGFGRTQWFSSDSHNRLLKATTRSYHRRGFLRHSPGSYVFLGELYCDFRLALRSVLHPVYAHGPPRRCQLQEAAPNTISSHDPSAGAMA